MSKTKQNIPKSKRGGYDLWGKRPMSGHAATSSWAKKMCRRIERKMKRKIIQEEIDKIDIEYS